MVAIFGTLGVRSGRTPPRGSAAQCCCIQIQQGMLRYNTVGESINKSDALFRDPTLCATCLNYSTTVRRTTTIDVNATSPAQVSYCKAKLSSL